MIFTLSELALFLFTAVVKETQLTAAQIDQSHYTSHAMSFLLQPTIQCLILPNLPKKVHFKL